MMEIESFEDDQKMAGGSRIIQFKARDTLDADVLKARTLGPYSEIQRDFLNFAMDVEDEVSEEKCVTEKYVVGCKSHELRERIIPELGSKSGTCGQLQIYFPDGDGPYVGTASICEFNGKGHFLLTAAHNFVRKMPSGPEYAETVEFYHSRNGISSFAGKYLVTKSIVHPKYITEKFDSTSGYDIAVASFKKTGYEKNKTISKNTLWGCIDNYSNIGSHSKVKIGTKICVQGYPAQFQGQINPGFQYKMDGTIAVLAKQDTGGMIVSYKDLDTSGGQSGSPLTFYRDGQEIIIGVHVAGVAGKENWATAITDEIFAWVEESERELM